MEHTSTISSSEALHDKVLSFLLEKGAGSDEAYRKAGMCKVMTERMRHDIARFHYLKSPKDGVSENRTAYGTLDWDIITAYDGVPKGDPKPEDDKGPFNGLVKYFDTERKAWRCVNVQRLVGFDPGWDFEDEA